MNKIKALIVDDEPLARDNIKILLKEDPDIEILGECRNGNEALEILRYKDVELLFLDIQMPGLNGFELLSKLESKRPPVIIFTTAYDHFAIDAFRVNALDYLLKPFSNQQFYSSLNKAKQLLNLKKFETINHQLHALLENYKNLTSLKPDQKKYLTKIAVNSSGRTYLLKVEDIDWFEAADYYIQIHIKKSTHLIRDSMNDLESRLDPEKFMRIHRSTIINLDRLNEIKSHFKGESIAVLYDGTKLKVSRSRKEKLTNKFKILD